MAAARREVREEATTVTLDEEELHHHAVEHKGALMWEPLARDLPDAPFAYQSVDRGKARSHAQKVHVRVRTSGTQSAQLLCPAAEDPAVRAPRAE